MTGERRAEQAVEARTWVRERNVECLHGADIEPELDALARLRIEVFREFPYLYEGTLAYEKRYLRDYASSPRSTLVLARAETRVVGAATALPLLDHQDAVQLASAFVAAAIAPESVYYFGESVLERAERGRGIGHAFFDAREASARDYGFSRAAFCAVERPKDHPARPIDYVPHDAFWTRRGFVRRPDLTTHFSWRDVGAAHESEKPMVCWLKELRP